MNFQTTDKLIAHLDNCVTFLTWRKFDEGIKLKERWPDLFSELVQITNSSLSEEEKQSNRILAFASNYKKPGDAVWGESMLRYAFDQEAVISQAKRYLAGQEPTGSAIEKEFWINCSNLDDVNKLCNVYRERWTGYLFEVDTDYYDWNNFLFDNTHELNINFKALRDCGLLTSNVTELECTLHHLAKQVNGIVKGIVDFFTAMRRTTIDTKELIKPNELQQEEPQSNDTENRFNGQPLTEVRKHFEILCEMENSSGDKLLTPKQLDEFINNAFVLNLAPKSKIITQRGGRDDAKIKRVFGSYWQKVNYSAVYFSLNNNQRKDYLRLLTDNFQGFDFDKIIQNFSDFTRPEYTKLTSKTN